MLLPNNRKKIHFIGICGVAMSALAIAFQKKGYQVSGSDAGFYPPVSTNLQKNKINFYPGWHVEKMCENGNPDLVIVGNVANSTNPEFVFAKENHLKYQSYPEAVAEFFVKKNSLVCAGTYGKTTSAALLSWIFSQAGKQPSYMFGGIPANKFESAELSESEWSILEGDEYKTSGWDMRPKFSLYSPTHLLLTSVSWDHADIYKTEEHYFEAFKHLVESIPSDGMIVGCFEGKNMHQILSSCKAKMIIYGKNPDADYAYRDVQHNQKGIHFDIVHQKNIYRIKSSLLGDFNAENITGCFAMAHSVGIDAERIIESISEFRGLKRRLERRMKTPFTIIDDIAHSPIKAQSTLETLKKVYKNKKIIVIFEPNTGNRKSSSVHFYDHAFAKADMVLIPRLTKIKHNPLDLDMPLEGKNIAEVIGKTHAQVHSLEDDIQLIQTIIQNTTKGDVVVFLGSHGFRGMIEELIEYVRLQEE